MAQTTTTAENQTAVEFWANLQWEVECFPDRYSAKSHIAAGLDPRDAANLAENPDRSRPSTALYVDPQGKRHHISID